MASTDQDSDPKTTTESGTTSEDSRTRDPETQESTGDGRVNYGDDPPPDGRKPGG